MRGAIISNPADIVRAIESYTYEMQAMKSLGAHFLSEIVEEVFEYNSEKNIITRYLVVLEEEKRTLGNIWEVWN